MFRGVTGSEAYGLEVLASAQSVKGAGAGLGAGEYEARRVRYDAVGDRCPNGRPGQVRADFQQEVRDRVCPGEGHPMCRVSESQSRRGIDAKEG